MLQPRQFGRGYVGYRETRNLRSRALVIAGASHKRCLEACLNQMHDVRIVPSQQVLR